jgi:non-heme chloroperoxidase
MGQLHCPERRGPSRAHRAPRSNSAASRWQLGWRSVCLRGCPNGAVVLDGPGHWASVMADALRAYCRALTADRATAVAASVNNMYTDQASDALRAWTARQILDASPHIDALFQEQTSYDPRPWLPIIAKPILYLHGALDRAVPLHVPQTLAGLTEGSAVIVIDGAGHLAQQERPVEVAAAIRAFGIRIA